MNLRNAIFLMSESGVALLFALCVALIWKREKPTKIETSRARGRDFAVIFSAAIFAAIFENLNVLQVHGRGSYSYNAKFHVFVGEVPLFVILAWAVIFWTAMQLCDAAPLRNRARIVHDAILAVLLDLAFDVTAIRHGFWFWHGVRFDEAWFGVPAGNFFGWFYVALAFALCTRFLDWRAKIGRLAPEFRIFLQLFAVPPLAFVLYRALENSNNALLSLCGWRAASIATDTFALGVFLAQLSGAIGWVLWRKSRDKTQIEYSKIESSKASWQTVFARAVRLSFHVFAILGLLSLSGAALTENFSAGNPAAQKPAMIGVAGLVWAFEIVYLRLLRASAKPASEKYAAAKGEN